MRRRVPLNKPHLRRHLSLWCSNRPSQIRASNHSAILTLLQTYVPIPNLSFHKYTKLNWINRRLRLILTSLVWSHLIFWKTLILIHSSIPMRIRPGLDSTPTYPMPLTAWKPVPVTACKRSSATVIRVSFFAKISIYPCTFDHFQLVLFGCSFLYLLSISLYSPRPFTAE